MDIQLLSVTRFAVNAPLLPEVFVGIPPQDPQLPLAAEGVQRLVCQGRFGAMPIEVQDRKACVNGQPVEPSAASAWE